MEIVKWGQNRILKVIWKVHEKLFLENPIHDSCFKILR
jgi:hypothetical protein